MAEFCDEIPYQICAERECDANTEGNRPYCGVHTVARCKCGKVMKREEREAGGICIDCYWKAIDGAQMAHDEMEERAEQESGYRSGKGE